MAVTLPYEDMEFVPLDILTAQEQNQLVANIEYLAGVFPLGSAEIADNAITTGKINNGAVTESKIANGAVTSQKINWTGIPFATPDYSNGQTISTIPYTSDGYYFIVMAINGDTQGKIIYVNENRVAQNNSTTAVTVSFFVKPGDVITQSASGQVAFAYRYPLSHNVSA